MLRDVLMGLPVSIMHVGSLYAVAAAITGIAVTSVIRILAVVFDLSLPEQRMLYRRKVAVETSAIPVARPGSE